MRYKIVMLNSFSELIFSSFRWMHSFFLIIFCIAILSSCAHESTYVEESRTLKSLKAAFDHSKDDIYKVYTKALRSTPDLQGRVMFRIIIKPNGHVVKVSIDESTLDDDEVLREVSGIIRRMDFGKVRRGESVVVTWPMEFLYK